MKKIIVLLLIIFFSCSFVSAGEIDKLIGQSGFELRSVVSIFVKDNKDNSTIYQRNSKKLLNPASILKTLTYGASLMTLGEDFEFETAIYKDSSNNLYIKLAGDPLLKSQNLEQLFLDVKNKINPENINTIYIDDTIIDKIPYPNGWMKDDMWPYTRALSPYIIDNNLTEILIKRSSLSTRIDIIQNDDYKLPIINELKLGEKGKDKQEVKIVREYGEYLPITNFKGIIVEDQIINMPVLDPKINFIIKTQNAIDKSGIIYHKKLDDKKVPKGAVKLASFKQNKELIEHEILFNSNNFVSEIVFKAAAAKYVNYTKPGSTEDGIKMFNEIFPDPDIKITDASGVSRYDLVDSEFIVNSLSKINAAVDLRSKMATANQGTLAHRLTFLKDNLKAKTGTLSKMSAICGYLTTLSNKDISFAIIIQNSPKRKAILKNFEDNVITELYRKY